MASDWWGVALALGTAAAQGYMAKKNVDAQKKDAKHAQAEWERAMEMQRQNMYDARNSPFAKVGMTMLDQMLHVYGDQSKGRGGFTLPVDQLSSMLGSFGSFGSVEDNRQNQQTIGGFNPDNSTGWYGPGNGNPGMGNRGFTPAMEAALAQGGFQYGRGGPREGNGARDSGALGQSMMGELEGSEFYEQAKKYADANPGMSFGDALRNTAWWYANLDGNPYGKGDMIGEAKQMGVRSAVGSAAQMIPGVGVLAKPVVGWLGNRADKMGFKGMFNYDDWGVAPAVAWNASPHMFNFKMSGRDGYGSSTDGGDPALLAMLSQYSQPSNSYSMASSAASRIHPSDLGGQMKFFAGEYGNYV